MTPTSNFDNTEDESDPRIIPKLISIIEATSIKVDTQ
jgi:hypothetical protein